MVNASKLGFIALKCGHLTPCSGIPFLVYSLSLSLTHTHTLSLSLLSARREEHMGRAGFDARSFPPWDGRSPVSHPTCEVPFTPRRTSRYRKGMISARPSYQGVRRAVWDPDTFDPGRRHVPRDAPSLGSG